jgi:hypothetical protein
MKRQIVTVVLVVAVGFGAIMVSGCETKAQTGALLGTAVGAGAGQLIGRNTAGTLIGAGVGAGAGYMLGNEQDKARQRRETEAIRSESNIATVWITNSNGSQLPVRLVKDGPGYIGPRGERYPYFPTEEQLRQVYGF